MDKYNFIVDNEFEGIRLDTFLSAQFENKSRSYFQTLLEDENIKVNGKTKKGKYKVKLNEEIAVQIPEPIELNVNPEDIPIDIVYEDKDVIVVNKPQGMVVHPAPGNYTGTLVNALLYHCSDLSGINGVIRPGIVHRIDKDTSGVLVVAKSDTAHLKLAEQFKDHTMTRTYYALTEGIIKSDEGIVNKPIARDPKERIKMAVVQDGKKAVTHYKVIDRFKRNTLVKCNLETGRTHQIRVHMASIGCPLVGDPVYGHKKQRFNLKGQVLHAKTLGFVHPSSGKYIEFNSELPDYFEKLLKTLKNELK